MSDNRAKFERMRDIWKVESIFLSSVQDMVELPSYQAIIAMGEAVVPFLIEELATDPNYWFVALAEITEQDPVPRDDWGHLDRMAAAWVAWGKMKEVVV